MPTLEEALTTVTLLPKSRVPAYEDIDQPQKKEPSVTTRQDESAVGGVYFHTSDPSVAESFVMYSVQLTVAPTTGRPYMSVLIAVES
mmetsp:Transcript_78702/g.235935  ORF Transcript_78702/g.235935 Transcript_78702/m.235935 type:complete len:87 (-) Transcript_78702:14-274(-)